MRSRRTEVTPNVAPATDEPPLAVLPATGAAPRGRSNETPAMKSERSARKSAIVERKPIARTLLLVIANPISVAVVLVVGCHDGYSRVLTTAPLTLPSSHGTTAS